MRGAGPIGDFGLCRAAFGTLVERLVRALAADRRAVRNCRVSLPCVTVSCTLIRQKARPLCCWAGLASQGTTGRVGRPDVSATPSATLHRLSESGCNPQVHCRAVGQRACVERSMAARAGPGPDLAMVNAAAKPASDGASPRPPVLLRRLPYHTVACCPESGRPAERVMRAAIRLGTYRAARSS